MLKRLFVKSPINEDFFDDASLDIEVQDNEETIADDKNVTGYDYIMFASHNPTELEITSLSDKQKFKLKKYLSDGLSVNGITVKFASAEVLLKYDITNETDIEFKTIDEIYDFLHKDRTEMSYTPCFQFRYIKFYIPQKEYTPKQFIRLLTELWDAVTIMLQVFSINLQRIDTFNEGHFTRGVYDGTPALNWYDIKAIKKHTVDLKKKSNKFFLDNVLEIMESFNIKWNV